MKRLVLDLYRRLVPAAVKRRIPARLKAALLGLAYARTGYADLRQWQIRHLHRAGRTALGASELADPLFDCSLQPVPFVTPQDGVEEGSARGVETSEPARGRFYAEFGFLGVKVKGELRDPETIAAGQVELRLDGRLLRGLGVTPAGDGHAKVVYTIRRPALALFPQEGMLSLHDVHGRPLPIDHRYFPAEPAVSKGEAKAMALHVPFGDGSLFDHLATTGPLDKKGWPRPDAATLAARQDRMLALYARVRRIFEEDFDRPLFILYGTLLGQVREGDFIAGDDDFDVGYLSTEREPAAIKAESIRIMEGLMARGFIVGLNHLGRPHRVRDAESGVEVHLDNHSVFAPGDGHVWLHPRARLPISPDGFARVEAVQMRGAEVLRPVGAKAFLAAHYGPGWRVPDPAYPNIMTASDRHVASQLAALCLTLPEQRAMARRQAARGGPGDFVALALEPPYPITRYAERVGF